MFASGFVADESIQILFGIDTFDVLDEVTADAKGVAAADIVIPRDAAGEYVVAMYAAESGHGFRTSISIDGLDSSSSGYVPAVLIVLVCVGILSTLLLVGRRRRRQDQ